jgi:4-diphosphocytidyl-2-C-methyl-D-erythritol kinase
MQEYFCILLLILELLPLQTSYMICFPNAKINLGLNIVEKRTDGFHNIESIFYPVKGLNDILEVIENVDSTENIFTSSGIEIPGNADDNLIMKALKLIAEQRTIPAVKVHLHKHIPIGAGLGGGSADASFFIQLMNEKFKLGFSIDEMLNLASQLGSDCAFFIKNETAYATEKGQLLEPLNFDLGNAVLVLIFSPLHISTKEAYAGVIPAASSIKLTELIHEPIEHWKTQMKNDFELSVFNKFSELEQTKKWLYDQGAVYASMTGTGSTVFGIFKQNEFDETIMKRSKFEHYYIS